MDIIFGFQTHGATCRNYSLSLLEETIVRREIGVKKLNDQTMFCPNSQHQVTTVARLWQLVAEKSGE